MIKLEKWEDILKRCHAEGTTNEEQYELIKRASSWLRCAVGSCMQNIIGDDWEQAPDGRLDSAIANASATLYIYGYRFTEHIQHGEYHEALLCLEAIKSEIAALDNDSIDDLRDDINEGENADVHNAATRTNRMANNAIPFLFLFPQLEKSRLFR